MYMPPSSNGLDPLHVAHHWLQLWPPRDGGEPEKAGHTHGFKVSQLLPLIWILLKQIFLVPLSWAIHLPFWDKSPKGTWEATCLMISTNHWRSSRFKGGKIICVYLVYVSDTAISKLLQERSRSQRSNKKHSHLESLMRPRASSFWWCASPSSWEDSFHCPHFR